VTGLARASFLLWVLAVALDLCAPYAGYWLPGRGHGATTDWDIDGGHFTDRCTPRSWPGSSPSRSATTC
jgi:hypothetical protein